VQLPTINAALNGLSAVLLFTGWRAIKRGDQARHARLMRAAFCTSAVFLASYLYYHFVVLAQREPTRWNGAGWTRPAYLVLLVTHVVLAAVDLPLALRVFWLAHREDWARHKAWARVTFPIWLYVSVTGVLVYLALYVWNPAPAATAAG